MAAAISYYALFSLLPLTLLLVTLFGFVLQRQDVKEYIIDGILTNTPLQEEAGAAAIRDAIDAMVDARGPLGAVSFALTLWSATGLFSALRTSLNVIWKVERKQPLLQQKLLDVAMALGVAVLFGASFGSTLLLQVVRRRAEDALGVLGGVSGLLWEVLLFLSPALLSLGAFAAIYRFLPNVKVRWREALVGAVVAALLFEAAKVVSALPVNIISSQTPAYGAISGVLVFLSWSYLVAAFVLLGAEVASQLGRERRREYPSSAPAPGARRGLRQMALRAAKGLFAHGDERDAGPYGGPPKP